MRLDCLSAGDEELHRLRVRNGRAHQLAVFFTPRLLDFDFRQPQGRNRIALLAANMEQGATGDQHHQVGTGGEECRQLGGGRPDLLDVIEHQQEVPVAQKIAEHLPRGLTPDLSQPELSGNRRQHQTRIDDWGQRDKRHTIRKRSGHILSHAQGEASLANPAWSRECQESRPAVHEQRPRGGNVVPATNK